MVVNYFKNFFGGEALHVQLDKFAPTPKEMCGVDG